MKWIANNERVEKTEYYFFSNLIRHSDRLNGQVDSFWAWLKMGWLKKNEFK
jgi:hypothetical protein